MSGTLPEGVVMALDGTRLARCRHGLMLYFARDRFIGRSLEEYGEYTEEEIELFAQVVVPGMTVVEAGTNIGTHTLPLARMVGEAGRVVAFEPQRRVFQVLCANLALNGIGCVEAHWAALGEAAGEAAVPALFASAAGNVGGMAIGEEGGEEVVPVRTVDGLGLAACGFMKVDVEGMEAAVLRGARATIARHRPVLYVENDRPAQSPGLIALLLELGYRCYWHVAMYVRVPNFRGRTDDVFGNMAAFNLVCLPRERAAVLTGFREVTGPQDRWHP